MRSPKCSPPVAFAPPSQEDTVTISLALKLITPMFGGGHTPREFDRDTPVRAAAIRGHLRFWWRATEGAQYATSEELYRAEAELWGSPVRQNSEGKTEGGPGRVQLRVGTSLSGQPTKSLDSVAPKGRSQRYFLFPFEDKSAQAGYEGAMFNLVLTCPSEDESAVRNTLRTWITFGGIGSRTRRGCGALTVTQAQNEWLPPVDPDTLQSWLNRLLPNTAIVQPAYTALPNCDIVLGKQCENANRAWQELGEFWTDFRKGHTHGERLNIADPCLWKDYWGKLEPNKSALQNGTQQELKLAKVFLGLPIIYQRFPNGKPRVLYAPTLESERSGRMASPVILKPVALVSGIYRPMIAVLQTPPLTHICVCEHKFHKHKVKVTPPDLDEEPVLRDLRASTPLEAVLKFAASGRDTQKYRVEVKP